MTQVVAPSASYEPSLEEGVSGLVGTLKLGVYDGDTATQALSAASINEILTSGVYVATRTAPGSAGQYVLVWSTDGSLAPDKVRTEDLIVTSDAVAAVGGTSNLYLSVAELKAGQDLTGTSVYDDKILLALSSACRAIDAYKQTPGFYPRVGESRYYSPNRNDLELPIHDLVSLVSVTVDADGDGVYETTWTRDTDFVLYPLNALTDGFPYNLLRLRRPRTSQLSFAGLTTRFPIYENSVKISGTFGWAETPPQVKTATKLLATRLFKRDDTPYGIMAAGTEAVSLARLGQIDPDVAFQLRNIRGAQPVEFTSVRLG